MRVNVLDQAQAGLTYNPLHGCYLELTLQDAPQAFDAVRRALQRLQSFAAELVGQNYVNLGVAPRLWTVWTGCPPEGGVQGPSIPETSSHFHGVPSEIWLFCKSETPEGRDALEAEARARFGGLACSIHTTQARRKAEDKILDHHVPDGITNPASPVGVTDNILNTTPGPAQGSAWAFVQRFKVKWSRYGKLSTDHKDEVIGRTGDGVLLADNNTHDHIRHARVFDNNRNNLKLMRQAMSYGHEPVQPGRERGIYFVAFAHSATVLNTVLASMVGQGDHPSVDALLRYVESKWGGYLYVPSAEALSLETRPGDNQPALDPFWSESSPNGLMFYNSEHWLNTMGTGRYAPGDPPSQRILGLAAKVFSKWRDNWYFEFDIPYFPNTLKEELGAPEDYAEIPIPIRRGEAMKRMLGQYMSAREYPRNPESWYFKADQFRVDPQDILLGVMPELSLGRGKQLMQYLTEEERMAGFLVALDENAPMGHIVPDHDKALDMGLGAIRADLKRRRGEATDPDKACFYTSALLAMDGVDAWMANYAWLARQMIASHRPGSPEALNLGTLAARMERLRTDKPETLVEAVQLLFVLHCCLHLCGNPTAIGRIDQLLDRPYKEHTPDAQAQEVLDALWLKLGEKALHNRAHATDHDNYGTTAVAYTGGNFPQGGGINQWVQQATVGGCLPNDAPTPQDACNRYTLLALKASRRLPLNAPCLSLRLHPEMDPQILEEAALALRSGGAHPILFHDARMVKALHERAGFSLADARNYACDGCYEPMTAGATEFAFSNVTPLDAVQCAMNRGAHLLSAGPIYLRGLKLTFPSTPPEQIESFEHFYSIFEEHLKYLTFGYFNMVFGGYGDVTHYAPSPLLSVLIEGCVEKGRDLSNGGARLHLNAPMFVGTPNAVDSLFTIKTLVFEEQRVSLPELLECLQSNWGHEMQEPFTAKFVTETWRDDKSARFQALRRAALALPKWGSGDAAVDALGERVVRSITGTAEGLFHQESGPVRDLLAKLERTYSEPGHPWSMHMQVGIGTFEGYVGDGAGNGASADGRLNGQPYASDLSPIPVPSDLPPIAQDPQAPNAVPDCNRNAYVALQSFNTPAVFEGFSNASPVDLNVREEASQEQVVGFIQAYLEGEIGSNLLTITVADPDTYAAAAEEPERYELVRVRMGGWTEYYAAMFPGHQAQHARRPFFILAP